MRCFFPSCVGLLAFWLFVCNRAANSQACHDFEYLFSPPSAIASPSAMTRISFLWSLWRKLGKHSKLYQLQFVLWILGRCDCRNVIMVQLESTEFGIKCKVASKAASLNQRLMETDLWKKLCCGRRNALKWCLTMRLAFIMYITLQGTNLIKWLTDIKH